MDTSSTYHQYTNCFGTDCGTCDECERSETLKEQRAIKALVIKKAQTRERIARQDH